MTEAAEQEQRALELKAKPWLEPAPDSWWVVTGTAEEWIEGASGKLVHKPVEYVQTLCIASYESGEGPCFLPMGYSSSSLAYVLPSKVTHAFEVLLVRRDDPTRAAWKHNQEIVDAAVAGAQ